jgi:hypothetical protein
MVFVPVWCVVSSLFRDTEVTTPRYTTLHYATRRIMQDWCKAVFVYIKLRLLVPRMYNLIP